MEELYDSRGVEVSTTISPRPVDEGTGAGDGVLVVSVVAGGDVDAFSPELVSAGYESEACSVSVALSRRNMVVGGKSELAPLVALS